MNKLIDYYVNLYIGEDREHGKSRVGAKRLWYLICHFLWIFILGAGFFQVFFEAIGRLFGVLK